ncbi:poly [ADP-ribose] polymerase 3-like [Limulus polyphemus]|uniref:Poly [ADP-ribose] polymerase n=1 Tax=Limulus polyphemus TaxID=6850 RepID=A0ABM1BX18_LIMPO|nr:poly [ADP-ribose] polymerase 3-like [Limulus polyphemus]
MAPRKSKSANLKTVAKIDSSMSDSIISSQDWTKLKIIDLKKMCKQRNVDSTGTKDVLVKRLQDHDNKADEPPAKLKKEDSEGTKIRKVFENLKNEPSKKGKSKPDEYCPVSTNVEVFEDFDCMLNQTNIGNNNNKYYVIQLLKNKTAKSYYVWNRWGRVGEPGLSALRGPMTSLESAKLDFKKKFQDKTRNKWENRDNFVPHPGKYTLLEMDSEETEDDEEKLKQQAQMLDNLSPAKKYKPSSLDKPTQDLLKFIFDEDMFKETMENFDIDVKKMPLGKLSKQQISKGFDSLLEVEEAIKNKKSKKDLEQLTNRFYTLIPHAFGRQRPPIIDTLEMIRQKKDMLLVLNDIEIAQSLLKEKADNKQDSATTGPHPVDVNYQVLKCKLELLSQTTEEYKIIKKYLEATGPAYLKLLDVWKIDRETEGSRFNAHSSIKNRKLLWHGTNVAVVAAIMKSGLRIMPHSGGRVGKGIYFASENSKSAGYVGPCHGIGIMFLSEVALGKEKVITQDDPSLVKPPAGFDSVLAHGCKEPDPKKHTYLELDGAKVIVPQGKPITMSQYNKSCFSQSEYLVYKESQARLRYLLKLKF